MSIEKFIDIWDNSPYTGTRLLVHLAYGNFAGDDDLAWPSYDSIAPKAKIRTRQVKRHVAAMVADGTLEPLGMARNNQLMKGRAPMGRGETVLYKVNTLKKGVIKDTDLKKGCHPGSKKGVIQGQKRVSSKTPEHIREHIREHSQNGNGEKGSSGWEPSDNDRSMAESLFRELTGLDKPDLGTGAERKAAAATWFQPLRRMLKKAGSFETFDLVLRDVVGHFIEEDLTLSFPRSVENVFNSEIAKKRRQPPEPDWVKNGGGGARI